MSFNIIHALLDYDLAHKNHHGKFLMALDDYYLGNIRELIDEFLGTDYYPKHYLEVLRYKEIGLKFSCDRKVLHKYLPVRKFLMQDIQKLGKVEWFAFYTLYQENRPKHYAQANAIYPDAKYVFLYEGAFYPINKQINFFRCLVSGRLNKSKHKGPKYSLLLKYAIDCPFCGYSTFSGINPHSYEFNHCHHSLVHQSDERYTEWLDELYEHGRTPIPAILPEFNEMFFHDLDDVTHNLLEDFNLVADTGFYEPPNAQSAIVYYNQAMINAGFRSSYTGNYSYEVWDFQNLDLNVIKFKPEHIQRL